MNTVLYSPLYNLHTLVSPELQLRYKLFNEKVQQRNDV
jgi:hypothetical protein